MSLLKTQTSGSSLLMYLYPHLCVGSATKKHAVNWLKLAVLTLIDDRSQITENKKIYTTFFVVKLSDCHPCAFFILLH